ncbi:hypothetical protein FDZ73_01050, partial [bacterium]
MAVDEMGPWSQTGRRKGYEGKYSLMPGHFSVGGWVAVRSNAMKKGRTDMKAKIILFSMMLAGLVAAHPALAKGLGKSPVLDKRVALFQNQLERQGFKVTHWEDAFGPINLPCLVCNGFEDIAYGNNAAAPYQVISETYEGVRV